MSFSYKDLNSDRQWKATTGMSENDFIILSNASGKAYEMKHELSLEKAAANLAREFALSSYKDCLFFVLFQLKHGLTQDCLSPVFNMDGSSAWRNFQKYRKQCFAAQHDWFKKFIVRLDLGFQGYADLYKCKKVFIPVKRKRVKKGCSNELSDSQKQINREQAQQRVGIEHSIGGMKRYRILSNRLRIKSTQFMDSIIGVCAGLWNFVINRPNQLIINSH